jgi:protein-S-isoprenylcysteine O-methyltransferase Ste14
MNEQLPPSKSNVTSGVIRWSVRELLELITFIPFLFWPAGTWNWPMAWALIGLGVLRAVGTAMVVVPRYPELLAERVGVRQGSKAWDMAIIGIIRVMLLAMMIIAGLDIRFAWTIKLPLWANMVGMVVALAGHSLFVWAMSSNAYFVRYVRIQGERGHTVATGGPYHYVRHPAYLGMLLVTLGMAVMLGSWVAFIPGGVAASLYVIRTMLEDRVLLTELVGYKAFAERTRYRLIPGVW